MRSSLTKTLTFRTHSHLGTARKALAKWRRMTVYTGSRPENFGSTKAEMASCLGD
jgi:hypothetical protein